MLAPRSRWSWNQIAAATWIVALSIIAMRLLLAHNLERHSLYPVYIAAARHWLAGADLYGPEAQLFRYSPLFAAGFTPFTLVPDRLGNLLWRAVNVAAYLGAAWLWWREVLATPAKRMSGGLFMLLLLPLSIGSINNGQSNPLLTALLLGSLVAVHRQRWLFASVLLAGAVYLKLYPLAILSLLLVLYPLPLGWRWILSLLAGATVCFLFQAPAYVTHQFVNWLDFLRGDLRLDQEPEEAYRDLRQLLHNLRVPISHAAYAAVQLAGALFTAALCFSLRIKKVPERTLLPLLYSAGISWILLLGPATESSTFILLAPALAWHLVTAWQEPRPFAMRVALGLCCLLLIINLTGVWFPFVKKVHATGFYPLAMLIFVGCLLFEMRIAIKPVASETETPKLPSPPP